MRFCTENLWLVPVVPLLVALVLSFTPQRHRRFAAGLAVGGLAVSFCLSALAFFATLGMGQGNSLGGWRDVHNFDWFDLGATTLRIGWVFDPLSAIMLVMVTFIGLLIFIYSIGYMAHDDNFTRFFCYLSLFAAAMLGLLIANSLLLFFICWELVGLASYLLIGFWNFKPFAAAAAKKAFITTRIGDVVFFLGILWLYSQAGTLLFYDYGHGCLENSLLGELAGRTTVGGIAVTTGIGLLIFCGAIGKSGQFPLHVWLPDAMEGPTPVSALIHAATMVAAGVFLMARVYPLLNPHSVGVIGSSAALVVVAGVGAFTAVFAAVIAVAQKDIKRILAYSTISQLGFMMMGLAVGGVAVAMFHLLTHAFFKALLFLGAGSVIHGCDGEQDVRRMGGLKKIMPLTFATYAVGMMALSGVPIFFSGFWSKDEILHAALGWQYSHWPFYLGIIGSLLTVFYMTRQICLVFFGKYRGPVDTIVLSSKDPHAGPHESPPLMTIPLIILAVFAVLAGFADTPAWPWLQKYLAGGVAFFKPEELFQTDTLFTMVLSLCIVALGGVIGWALYGDNPAQIEEEMDPLERARPDVFYLLQNAFFVDELYEGTIIRFNAWWSHLCDDLEFWLWQGGVLALGWLVVGLAWLSRLGDQLVINPGFDQGCHGLSGAARWLSRLQNGQTQSYLRIIGLALAALALVLLWSGKPS